LPNEGDEVASTGSRTEEAALAVAGFVCLLGVLERDVDLVDFGLSEVVGGLTASG
jgi:hypothetical protein